MDLFQVDILITVTCVPHICEFVLMRCGDHAAGCGSWSANGILIEQCEGRVRLSRPLYWLAHNGFPSVCCGQRQPESIEFLHLTL